MITTLIAQIEEHPAMRHGVFTKLAERKLPPEKLARYLRDMGAFCEASRFDGNMVNVLKNGEMFEQAQRVENIFASEAGHGDDFAEMARLLLRGDPSATFEWSGFWTKNMFKAISVETHHARAYFLLREHEKSEHAYYSLGVMLVVEIAAHRQIIPGEVAAFIDSGFYGLTLADVPYLDKHAGEHGAEHHHEEAIQAIIASLKRNKFAWRHIKRGCSQFLHTLNAFYNRLEASIT